jgi:hypothetical protein
MSAAAPAYLRSFCIVYYLLCAKTILIIILIAQLPKMKLLFATLSALLAGWCSFAQPYSFSVSNASILRSDSSKKQVLLSGLSAFLDATAQSEQARKYALPEHWTATTVLLDELKELSNSKANRDTTPYRCFLNNIIPLNDSDYVLQLSYMANTDDTPRLGGMVSLCGRLRHDKAYFYSPLDMNTAEWKLTRMGNTVIHHRKPLNKANALKYFNQIAAFDKKLNAPRMTTQYYCCDHFVEVLQLIGVSYKADYTGIAHNSLYAKTGDTLVVVNGIYGTSFNNFDPHDLWHARLHNVLSTEIINRPVDEGTAYLYGGSWGLSWKEILDRFRRYAANNPGGNWLELYNASKNFDPTGKYPLNVDFAINALIAQKLEREKGFPAVIELLSCGRKQKDNGNYFAALKKLLQVDQAGFNDFVNGLIAQAK